MHPLLRRQLRRCAIDGESGPSDLKGWQSFLQRVNNAYQQVDEDRYLLERSLAVSSEEMNRLYASLRESEAKLGAERDKLRATISCLGDGLCMLDREGRVALLNPEGQRILGWGEAELAGARFGELVLGDQASSGVAAQVRDDDGVLRRKDGSMVPVAYVLDPIRHDEAVLGAVIVFRDITEQKRNEELLVRAREAALETSRLKAEFLANMSHEIRTPMNGVIGMAELLLEHGAHRRSSASTPRRSTTRPRALLTIINDILDFSKIEAGKLELEHDRRSTCAPWCDEVVELLAEQRPAQGPRARLPASHRRRARLPCAATPAACARCC